MRTLIGFVLEKALQTKKLNSYTDFKLYCLNLAIRKKNRDSLNKSCFTSLVCLADRNLLQLESKERVLGMKESFCRLQGTWRRWSLAPTIHVLSYISNLSCSLVVAMWMRAYWEECEWKLSLRQLRQRWILLERLGWKWRTLKWKQSHPWDIVGGPMSH